MKNSHDVQITLLAKDKLAVSFSYRDEFVVKIRGLSERRWDPELRHWEVGISQLSELMQIFALETKHVPRDVMRAYQVHRIRHGRVKITVGPCQATIVGFNLPLAAIDRQTSCFVPGYRFMKTFRDGNWDGKRHFFDPVTGQFPSGFVPRIVKILRQKQLDFDLVWMDGGRGALMKDKPAAPGPQPDTVVQTPLRDYQARCVKVALSDGRGIIEIATGGGKTLIGAHIIHRLPRPALFLVHSRDMLYQTIQVLERELKIPIGCVGDGHAKIETVTVATVQTCARAADVKLDSTPDGDSLAKDKNLPDASMRTLREFLQSVPVVIFDECHHLPADTVYGLAMSMTSAHWRFGLSATPYRADRQELLIEAALGPKLFSARASALIEQGYLVPPRVRFLQVPPLVVRGNGIDYQEIYKTYVVENRRRNKLIADSAKKLARTGKSVLVLVLHVVHGEILHQMMGGIPLVHGTHSAKYRQETFTALNRKELLIAIATALADEGLDIPTLDCIILAGAGRSETRALQRVGRALRKAPGKDHAIIIDFMDDAPYLRDHAADRLNLYKTEPQFILEVDQA